MDFKSFKKNRPQQNAAHPDENARDDLRKTAEKYANKSDSDLLREIMRAASKSKQDGSLSQEHLSRFVASVSPMLNEEQRARLSGVVEMINKS